MDDSFDVPGEEDESYFFGVMETIFVGWFTFIFIVRFLMAPDKGGLKREDQTKQRNQIKTYCGFSSFDLCPKFLEEMNLY